MWCCIAYTGGCGLRLAAGAAPHPVSLALHSPWLSCRFAATTGNAAAGGAEAEGGAAPSVPAFTTDTNPLLDEKAAAEPVLAAQPGGGGASAQTASAGSRCGAVSRMLEAAGCVLLLVPRPTPPPSRCIHHGGRVFLHLPVMLKMVRRHRCPPPPLRSQTRFCLTTTRRRDYRRC